MFGLAVGLLERNFGLSELVRGYIGQETAARVTFKAHTFQRQCLIVALAIGFLIVMIAALSSILTLVIQPTVTTRQTQGLHLLQFALGLGLVGETVRQLNSHTK